MENLKKAMIIRGGNVIGAVGDKNFSTAPIGTVLAYAGNEAPRGYLLADGTSYPTAEYPDLYAVIGNTYGGDSTNFNVPDYRETVLVGVGENTTDTIADHDVYELGEFKDDQLQNHTHTINTGVNTSGSYIRQAGTYAGAEYSTTSSTIRSGRTGTTTHGKQKGVTYIIKAFHTNEGTDSGVSDDVVEYVDGEIAEVETALPNIKKFANPGGTAKYITISGATLGDIEVHSAYAGKYMFTSTGANPIFFGTSTYLGYTLTGWAWNSDKTKLYFRVNGHRDFVISAFGSDGVEISDIITTAPTDVTFNTTFNYNAYIDNSTSENTSTYSSAKIDTELNKRLRTYSKQWYGSHDRYVKLGSVPISTGSVSVGSLLVTLFASSTKLEEYPVGTISLNISSGAGVNAFNINGFSTIALNTPRTDNNYTPRIVVDKTSTHYVLYVDCSYNYLKVNCSILNSTNFTFGDFETTSALEGTEAWSSVTSDDIKYVGEMAKLDDSSTGNTTSTWSSSKIASEMQWKLLGSLTTSGDLSDTIPDTANEIYVIRRNGATIKDFSFILPIVAITNFGTGITYVDNFVTGATYGIQIEANKKVKLNSTLESGRLEIYYR